MEERIELAVERLKELVREEDLGIFRAYFNSTALFLIYVSDVYAQIKANGGKSPLLSEEELKERNTRLYEDILGDNYAKSFVNPDFAVATLGESLGGILSALAYEMRAVIPFAFEQDAEAFVIRLELFLEIYGLFENSFTDEGREPSFDSVKDALYWYLSDYSDIETERRFAKQFDEKNSFAADIIAESDLRDLSYLYLFGEYVSENELRTAKFVNSLPEELVEKIAFTYTDGFKRGFIQTKKNFDKKETINIRYRLGFERIIKAAIGKFAEMGLKPVIYRAENTLFNGSNFKIGYYGAEANRQCDYDHKEDLGYFLDGHLVTRKIECIEAAFKTVEERCAVFAGPACMETFGETLFEPVNKKANRKYTDEQNKMVVELSSAKGTIMQKFINMEERSFTIIAFPVPEIGEDFEKIFDDTVRINTLDAALYQRIQSTIIDTLDTAEYVHIEGMNGNETDLNVSLSALKNPDKETKFENCVADVNIPVGEVFTSPKLEGTNGILNVRKVFLEGLEYRNLRLEIKDGVIKDYTCSNFDDAGADADKQNRAYIEENILFHHETLPMGEFAIGTNTTAYVVARKYNIEAKMPILIAEKTGPHFAFGDTCYSLEEDVRVFNPDGKEMIAKENSFSLLRTTDRSKAYFQCHTDITIPYDELGLLEAVRADGSRIPVIVEGRFVLEGCEELNRAFDF